LAFDGQQLTLGKAGIDISALESNFIYSLTPDMDMPLLSPSMLWLLAGSILCLLELFLPTALVAFLMGISAFVVAVVALDSADGVSPASGAVAVAFHSACFFIPSLPTASEGV
jgi:membrane-bound ClpP family serine protease